MKAVRALLLALVVAACAPDSELASSKPPQGQLVVKRVQPDGPIGLEGTVAFARIETEHGSVVAEEGFDAPDHGTDAGTYGYPRRLKLQLESGTYTLVSYQRACDASCEKLAPPKIWYTCQHPIEVEEGATVTAEVDVSISDCEIEVSTIDP